jgi:hypothetical protein
MYFIYQVLIVGHVALTTAGYMGLIAASAWLLALSRSEDPRVVLSSIRSWRGTMRVFGPLLGIGMLVGFGLAFVMRIPLLAPWLIAAYALIVIGMVTQGAIMIPWQARAEGTLAAGEPVKTRPIATVIAIFSAAYVGLLGLMLVR